MGGALPVPDSRVRTVTELTLALQGLVAEAFEDVWVRGEVTNLRRVASGHVYFALKDEGAVLPSVIWRSAAARLRFQLEDGIELVCRGALDVYPPHGKYQLIVQEAQPLGAGALQLAFEQLKKRLAAEGLFDAARKVPLPFLPRRIALVTSKSGAAVRDLVTVIHRRFPPVEIVLVAAKVQGPGAAQDVARALALADARSGADVIVCGRGGGSLEDLWAFNEEPVARAIAACETPVVSAVGHEIDVTIADLVADVRAATPSQAGELVVPVYEDLRLDLEARAGRVRHLVRTRVDRAWQRLEAAAGRPVLRDPVSRSRDLRRHLDQVAARLASRSPRTELDRRREALGALAARAAQALGRRAERAGTAAAGLESRLRAATPRARIDRARVSVEALAGRAAVATRHRLDGAHADYEGARGRVEALSPLRVLDRGYSLTRVDGRLLKSVAQARPGQPLTTQTADGVVESRVEAVRPSPRHPETRRPENPA